MTEGGTDDAGSERIPCRDERDVAADTGRPSRSSWVEAEARVRIPEHADKCRFVICENWGHFFEDSPVEESLRWIFDRRTWSVAVAHVRDRIGRAWFVLPDDEIRDLEESLLFANVDVIGNGSADWDCAEADEMPSPAWKGSDPARCDPVECPDPGSGTPSFVVRPPELEAVCQPLGEMLRHKGLNPTSRDVLDIAGLLNEHRKSLSRRFWTGG